MAGPDTIPDLNYQKPDGTLLSRIEMEEQMRQVWSKIFWIRIKANKIYQLPRQAAFDMREAMLRHWTLDEMIRRGQITGDVSGIDTNTYNDEASIRQFIQSLQYLVQTGQAVMPQEGEGVDMSNFTPPPPPMGAMPPSNGVPPQQQFTPPPQQGFAPPPGYQQQPPGPPQQFQPPQQQAPQGYPQPPAQFQPPQPQGMPPGGPQFAPPVPGAGMPQLPSTPVPPMPGSPPPQMPPQQGAPAPASGGRRKRGAAADGGQAPAPQQAAPVPPMQQGFPGQQFSGPPGAPQQFQPPGAAPQGYAQQPPPAGPPQGFVPPGAAQPPPQQFAPQPQPMQMPAQAPVAAAPDPALAQKLDQILANQAKLSSELMVIQAGVCAALRVTYQKPGEPNLRAFLAELGIQLPQ